MADTAMNTRDTTVSPPMVGRRTGLLHARRLFLDPVQVNGPDG
jgi:hypothetical protein